MLGHQRGWEILTRRRGRAADRVPALPGVRPRARRATRWSWPPRPRSPTPEGEVPVVTDPHYNTLLSHEIVGHPVELDRGAQDGDRVRRTLLAAARPRRHQLGRRIASPLVSAFSDPSLPGYGHYAYDHEGTPARRVVHIDRGVFTGFMNSRQTAAIFGGDPNGHWKATDASLVPLIRMSIDRVRGRRPATRRSSSRRSTTATSWSATGRRPSRRAARTFASPRARSTRSTAARSAGSTATGASWRTAATS